MLAELEPKLFDEVYAFVTVAAGSPLTEQSLASFREEEGLSLIVPLNVAGQGEAAPMRRITLQVHSALDGVGLTAAIASRLAEHGIACNMVAATRHDHLFVPADDAERALGLLRELQAEASGSTPAAAATEAAPRE